MGRFLGYFILILFGAALSFFAQMLLQLTPKEVLAVAMIIFGIVPIIFGLFWALIWALAEAFFER